MNQLFAGGTMIVVGVALLIFYNNASRTQKENSAFQNALFKKWRNRVSPFRALLFVQIFHELSIHLEISILFVRTLPTKTTSVDVIPNHLNK